MSAPGEQASTERIVHGEHLQAGVHCGGCGMTRAEARRAIPVGCWDVYSRTIKQHLWAWQ